jgi:hypothetical protein
LVSDSIAVSSLIVISATSFFSNGMVLASKGFEFDFSKLFDLSSDMAYIVIVFFGLSENESSLEPISLSSRIGGIKVFPVIMKDFFFFKVSGVN